MKKYKVGNIVTIREGNAYYRTTNLSGKMEITISGFCKPKTISCANGGFYDFYHIYIIKGYKGKYYFKFNEIIKEKGFVFR